MAKSLRSKWKRKMRAIKRVRYGEKENVRLVKMIDTAKESEAKRQEEKDQAQMEHEPQTLGDATDQNEGKMEDSQDEGKHSSTTLKSDAGSYPVWLSNRKIQKLKAQKKVKKPEGKINKRHKKKYL